RPHANVRVRLCSIRCCQGHPYGTCDHAETKRFLRALRGWSRLTDQLYIWHYITNFSHYPFPMPNLREMHTSLQLYQRYGVYGVFLQGMGEEGGGAELSALRAWLIGRLLWDPQQALWPLVDEFLAAYVGRAAPQVRRYLDIFHERVRRHRHIHPSLYDSASHPLFDQRTLAAAERALTAGEKVVQGEERFRVRLLRHGCSYVRICQKRRHFRIRGNWYVSAAAQEDRQRLAKMVTDWRKAGLQRLREGKPFAETVSELERSLCPHKLEWLTAAAARIAAAPALGGRLVAWQQFGHQWLALPDPDFPWAPYPMSDGYAEAVILGLYTWVGNTEVYQAKR
ncbi:MAG: DUF4838 domain-containing protein, partial [Planctomycetota bacterium]|nr:DUF4838 domain-containing protein [Planctomycetota bacterium]